MICLLLLSPGNRRFNGSGMHMCIAIAEQIPPILAHAGVIDTNLLSMDLAKPASRKLGVAYKAGASVLFAFAFENLTGTVT